MTSTDTSPAANNNRSSRDYIVLQHDDENDAWVTVNTFTGTTVDDAIETAASLNGEGLYAAIPARYWSSRRVALETVPKVTITPA